MRAGYVKEEQDAWELESWVESCSPGHRFITLNLMRNLMMQYPFFRIWEYLSLFLVFYAILRMITGLSISCHWSPSSANWIQCTPSFSKMYYINVFQLLQDFQMGHFLHDFSNQNFTCVLHLIHNSFGTIFIYWLVNCNVSSKTA